MSKPDNSLRTRLWQLKIRVLPWTRPKPPPPIARPALPPPKVLPEPPDDPLLTPDRIWSELLTRYLPHLTGLSVLELGCGTGEECADLALAEQRVRRRRAPLTQPDAVLMRERARLDQTVALWLEVVVEPVEHPHQVRRLDQLQGLTGDDHVEAEPLKRAHVQRVTGVETDAGEHLGRKPSAIASHTGWRSTQCASATPARSTSTSACGRRRNRSQARSILPTRPRSGLGTHPRRAVPIARPTHA